MARYIDADAAAELARLTYCKDCKSYNGVMCRACAFDDAMSFIDDFPEADVAPRAEVAREIFKEIEELFRQHKEGGYYLDGAWFPERLDLYTEDAFAELKKKYTEGQK